MVVGMIDDDQKSLVVVVVVVGVVLEPQRDSPTRVRGLC